VDVLAGLVAADRTNQYGMRGQKIELSVEFFVDVFVELSAELFVDVFVNAFRSGNETFVDFVERRSFDFGNEQMRL
jgi:hypothetical protein